MWTLFVLIVGLSCLMNLCESNKPILQEVTIPKIINENQTIKLFCSAIEGERIKFEWLHNDKKVEENTRKKILMNDESSELVIKQLSIDDLGEYKCIGSNDYAKDVQKVTLHFNGKLKFNS